MKTTTIALISVASILVSACASAPLPQKDREVTFVENTNLSKKEAFNRALVHLSKSLGDSNYAIKMKDAESGTIITRIAVECNELRNFMDVNNYTAVFNLEFNAKDKRARFVFEAVEEHVGQAFTGRTLASSPISDKKSVDTMKACAARIKDSVLAEFGGSGKDAKDW